MKTFLSLLFVLLNSDVWACTQVQQAVYDPQTYYASVSGLQGNALKAALNDIIKNHTRYDYSPCTWEILKQADEHPADPNSVIGIYTRRAILKTDRDQGGNTPDYWNREHVWPKGHGFPNSGQYAYTDTHMLRASDKSVNADRGNRDFASGGIQHSECTGCYYTADTWEPPDAVKGDIARIMFYMVVRYEGSDSSSTPDLELVDNTTASGQPLMGELCELLQWHIDDPVSAAETGRNGVIYSWQGNRNPFIDHPEYALPIWGAECGIVIAEEEDNDIPFPLWMNLLLLPGIIFIQKMFHGRRK